MRSWRVWAGLLVSLVFIYFALRNQDFGHIWQALREAEYGWLIPAVAVYFLGVMVRAVRWHYLLRAVQDIPPRRLFPIVVIGYMANNILPLRAGEVVLVHAGAGGVGLAAIQLAKAWGGKVIATAGGPEKTAICREHGADLAIDYLSEPWVEKVKEFTAGRGADIIYDPVGEDVTDLSLKCLAWRGRLLIVGFAGGRIPAIPANRLLLKSASAIGVLWGERRNREPELAKATFADLFAMYERGEIRPVICREYPLADAHRALMDLGGRNTYGKAVLIP